ncbi:MAG TPA: CheR family methyltransferase [Vulgatibacter sp.]|nr:CheR family methyltransferase [Vulgatibacter sp.]
MTPAMFATFRRLIYEHAGIDLREGKESLLEARVAKRVRALGLPDEASYLHYLEVDPSGEEIVQFLDVVSTNFTSFFREPEHFQEIASRAASWRAQGQRRFRFWSAASSSGEEPYSLAMVLSDVFANCSVDWRILATDISTRVLAQARTACYTAEQVKTIPRDPAAKCLEATGEESPAGPIYRILEPVRQRVSFKRLNLAHPPFPMRGPLDAVFCRNVMIYFSNEVRSRLVREIERLLRPDGLLFIGHSESLTGLETGLEMVRPSVYRKPA